MRSDEISVEDMAGQIGVERVSDWIEVTQAMIAIFAQATGDDQFIHVDPVRAAATPFGGTIAHGFLLLALMPMLAARAVPPIAGARMGVNYGGNKVRFVAPVRAGSRVRGRFTPIEFTERDPGVWQQVQRYVLEIEGETKPALIAEWISLVYV